jgi:hypothetical protein
MFGLRQLFYPWGFVVQAVALVHFARRRPESYWLYIILFGGLVGASAYIVVEVLPDAGLLRGVFQGFGRRSRIQALEIQIIDNPSAGNFEELGELCLEQKQFAKARDAFDKAIAARSDSPHAFYNRATITALPVCLQMRMREPANSSGQRPTLQRRHSFRPRLKRCTTTPIFCACRIAAMKRANGRKNFWPKNEPCLDTCSEWNGRGSERARR